VSLNGRQRQADAPGFLNTNGKAFPKKLLIFAAWTVAVFLFASQWYAYDAAHGFADPFIFYVGWSCYLWGVLTPLAVCLAWRHPIGSSTWMRAIAFHLVISVLLTTVQLSIEAWIAVLRADGSWPLIVAVRHYLTQHVQVGLMTYWLVLGATHFYRIYDEGRTRQLRAAQLEARLAELQIQNLRAQLHPHFLFNTLQAAATLIHEDPGGAEDILLRLSDLLRISLDEMRTQEIRVAREIEFLEHYIAIQQRRFGDRLRFELQINPNVIDCAVPTLVLQPLVENAIRHGIAKSRDKDVVTVRAFRDGQHLRLEVANLASTLDDTPEQLFPRGVGLSNTEGRLAQLYGEHQSLALFNLKPRGVCVRLSIPLRELPADERAPARAVTA
jgi:two-component system, LytTR family, sensor kinase